MLPLSSCCTTEQGALDSTAAPSDAAISHSATPITDMKITWGPGSWKSLAYLGREQTMEGNEKLVTEMFRAYLSQENIQILT